MRSAQILISLALIPALAAAPPDQLSKSVRRLVNKPRLGPARFTWTDGTQADGNVLRVTNQFITFRGPTGCENVELSAVGSIKWLPEPNGGGDKFVIVELLLLAPFWAPGLVVYVLSDFFANRDPRFGQWQSVQASPEGKIRTVYLREHNISREDVLINKGHYRTANDELRLTSDGAGDDESIPIRFECDALILESSSGQQKLRAEPVLSRHADPPIVGRWVEGTNRRAQYWQFKPNGTFEMKLIEDSRRGTFNRTGSAIKVRWNYPVGLSVEEWGVQVNHHHLFITEGRTTTEYKH